MEFITEGLREFFGESPILPVLVALLAVVVVVYLR